MLSLRVISGLSFFSFNASKTLAVSQDLFIDTG